MYVCVGEREIDKQSGRWRNSERNIVGDIQSEREIDKESERGGNSELNIAGERNREREENR